MSEIAVYVYKNGVCDPARNIGTARMFPSSKEADEYIKMFAASVDPRFVKNYRIFITDKDINFATLDNYILMDEFLEPGDARRVEEVALPELARELNTVMRNLQRAREEAKKKAMENPPPVWPKEPYPDWG